MMYIKVPLIALPALLMQALVVLSEVKFGDRGSSTIRSFAMLNIAD